MRRGTFRALAGLASLGLLVAGCGERAPTELRAQGVPSADASRETVATAAEDTTAFASDLYRQLAARQGNFAFSPVAVATGLAMSRTGAGGVTASQLTDLLHAGQTPSFDAGLGAIWRGMDDRSGERRTDVRLGRVDLHTPSAIWVQRGTHLQEEFLTGLARDYDAGVQVVDFRSTPESARRAMNAWADDQTGGAVAQLVAPGTITQLSHLVLASAISLRAPWEVAFPADQTRPRAFHLLDGQTVDVAMMSMREREALSYAHGDGWEAVSLPYLGREMSMVVILPADGAFGAFEQRLDGSTLEAVLSSLRPAPVDLQLPRFAFTTGTDLDEALSAMGTATAFSAEQADFQPMTTEEPLAISTVVHQASLAADEQGTDGAAVTVITGQAPPKFSATTVTVDRPFIVVVRDEVTGALLYLGRVINPLE